jgi:hypothetical protein
MSESIALQQLSSAWTSKWSLESDSLKHTIDSPQSPTRPARALLPFRRSQAPKRQTYYLGDPVFIGDPPTPYTFQGWGTRRSRGDAGEITRDAVFRAPGLLPPYEEITLTLHRDEQTVPRQPSPLSQLWRRIRRHFIEWFY